MKNYSYKYVVTNDKVIALSSYAGKTVRGVAKCHPNDEFDVEFGKKLAAARCNAKIARKRYERARNRYDESANEYMRAYDMYEKNSQFFMEAYMRFKNANIELNKLCE